MKPGKMKMRAVQLDLARQMETLPFIREFIDFASTFGYNSLVLYLEARIKTRSFPYPSKEACYTPEEMEQVVAYAAERKMQVIPVVPNLGHTEQFLQYPALAPLAELREGRMGRFSKGLSMVCPSLEETYEFFDAYYSEIAAIFPSPYFHVGNDESWDIGYCARCRRRIKEGESQADIFTRHLKRTHETVVGKLGKKMIMWDDLFEHYRKSLQEIPRDIIMCCWHYDELVDIPRAHFCNRLREDWLKVYDQIGFSYLIAPAEHTPANGETFTRYAANYSPLGAHLTSWEKGTSFLYEHYPTIAYLGRLWQSGWPKEPVSLFHEVCRQLFGVNEAGFLEAVRVSQYLGDWPLPSSVEGLLRGPFTASETKRSLVRGYLYQQLVPFLSRVSPLGRKILQDILIRLKEENLSHRLRQAVAGLSTGVVPAEKQRLNALGRSALKELGQLKEERVSQWQQHRPGLPARHLVNRFQQCQQSIATFLEKAAGNNLLSFLWVNYFLPDAYNAQKVRLSLWFQKNERWQEVYSGVPKPNLADPGQTPFFTLGCCLEETEPPEKIRIESWGYGGIGLTYLKLVTPKETYLPAGILRKRGLV
ncbi:MAG TPA: family 20 glycosylhydrolase, partial [bacterium]|nr:family 20 glycosylhydrolase [bacterium]